MFEFLKEAFMPKQNPRPHHEILIEEAEKTGDDARLMAQIILNWAWAKYDQKPFTASAAEFIENLTAQGYKVASALSQDEKKNLSPRKLLICEALEGIQKTGHLDGRMGHALRHFSETGEMVKAAAEPFEPSGYK